MRFINFYKPKMCYLKFFATIALVLVSIGCTNSKSFQIISREKRTSDQRLAELETLFALSKMNGKLVTVSIGFGKIDPTKLGRRRRSIDHRLRQLIKDLSADEKLGNEIRLTDARLTRDFGQQVWKNSREIKSEN